MAKNTSQSNPAKQKTQSKAEEAYNSETEASDNPAESISDTNAPASHRPDYQARQMAVAALVFAVLAFGWAIVDGASQHHPDLSKQAERQPHQ